MDWTTTKAKYNYDFGADPFDTMREQAAAARAGGIPTAKVTGNAGVSAEYAASKVSFSITVEVPQTEWWLNFAAEVVYLKCVELTNQGAAIQNINPIQVDV